MLTFILAQCKVMQKQIEIESTSCSTDYVWVLSLQVLSWGSNMNLWPEVLIFRITVKIAEKLPTVENMEINYFSLKKKEKTNNNKETLKHNR